jgi:serralysin
MAVKFSDFKSIDGPLQATIGDPNRGLDPYAGNTYRGKLIADKTTIIGHIDSGVDIVPKNGVITYAFADSSHSTGITNNPNYGFTSGYGFSAFTEEQRVGARAAIQLWDDLTTLTFKEVNGPGAAQIVYANSYDPAQAYAYYPTTYRQGYKFPSDVYTATPSVNGSNAWLRFGGYGETTLIHETGHALGLSHPGDYNFGPGFAVNYTNGAEYAQDSKEYSIMSYWSDRETGALVTTWNTFLAGQPQTPMLHDILTIQDKYGADPTTRLGDTTYGFNSNAGRDVFDFNKNPYPMLSIYDAGGAHDKIDLSGFTTGQFVDLHAGSFSSIGGAAPSLAKVNADRALWNSDSHSVPGDDYYLAPITQANYDSLVASRPAVIEGRIADTTGVSGIVATEFSNFSIAYGTIIEDATGGSARDLLWGNEVANILHGGGGNDVLRGFEGNDTLYGDAGSDTFVFDNNGSKDTIADFQTGLDKIDLSNILGATSNNVTFDAISHTLNIDVDHNGTTDVSIIVLGSNVSLGADVLFHA